MEHRWGNRRALSLGVKLYTRHGPPKFGRLLNASASGAYVAMSAMPPIMTRVQIALGWNRLQRGGRHRIAAYVVRIDARGIGIEWHEFAPPPVLALIQALEVPPARTRRRASAGGRLPLVMHYTAQPPAVKHPVSKGTQMTDRFSASNGSWLLPERVERNISLGDGHIARQQDIIESLRRRGHDTALAEEVLATFWWSQKLHVAERDRLLLPLDSMHSQS